MLKPPAELLAGPATQEVGDSHALLFPAGAPKRDSGNSCASVEWRRHTPDDRFEIVGYFTGGAHTVYARHHVPLGGVRSPRRPMLRFRCIR